MAFTYGFYDSLNGDRKYSSGQMSQLIDSLIKDGVFPNKYNIFSTVPGPDGLSVLVKSGLAWFNSTWNYNDGDLRLDLEPADVTLSRIDSVVLEVDTRQTARTNRIFVKKGAPSVDPQPPELINAEGIYQHALAWVTLAPGATAITGSNINIRVGFTDCPFITGIAATAPIDPFFQQWEEEFDTWFGNLQEQLTDNVATNLQNQIDELDDALDVVSASVPLKATSAEVAAGTNDSSFITPQKLKSARNLIVPNDRVMVIPSFASSFPASIFTCNMYNADRHFMYNIYPQGSIVTRCYDRTTNQMNTVNFTIPAHDHIFIDYDTALVHSTSNNSVYFYSIDPNTGNMALVKTCNLQSDYVYPSTISYSANRPFLCFLTMDASKTFYVYRYNKNTNEITVYTSKRFDYGYRGLHCAMSYNGSRCAIYFGMEANDSRINLYSNVVSIGISDIKEHVADITNSGITINGNNNANISIGTNYILVLGAYSYDHGRKFLIPVNGVVNNIRSWIQIGSIFSLLDSQTPILITPNIYTYLSYKDESNYLKTIIDPDNDSIQIAQNANSFSSLYTGVYAGKYTNVSYVWLDTSLNYALKLKGGSTIQSNSIESVYNIKYCYDAVYFLK